MRRWWVLAIGVGSLHFSTPASADMSDTVSLLFESLFGWGNLRTS